MEHFDVVVIGAGMSGLAAGVRAAHFGRRVLILEKHSVWGGLNSFYKKGGHHFDTGLHAVTNWLDPTARGRSSPLKRVCRQLRIRLDELELEPQTRSSVAFDEARLVFTNDLDDLTEEVRRVFPRDVDGFVRLAEQCEAYPDAIEATEYVSSRAVLRSLITEPLLIEMILCPILYYGSAEENDIDFAQFKILFNSILREGLCRPRRGVRQILDVLTRRLEEEGGEVRRRCGVARIESGPGAGPSTLILEHGEPVTANVVLSSAGRVETERLLGSALERPDPSGQLSFVESIWVLDTDPKALGFDDCVTFFNRGPEFRWRRPAEPVDFASGVVCVPSNYAHAEPLGRWVVRATHLADHAHWFEADPERYAATKAHCVARSQDVVARLGSPFAEHVVYTDAFTPRTVTHYTGHINGAIYGSWKKQRDGRTSRPDVFLIGADQGLVGIVGAMLSGITMANAKVLVDAEGA